MTDLLTLVPPGPQYRVRRAAAGNVKSKRGYVQMILTGRYGRWANREAFFKEDAARYRISGFRDVGGSNEEHILEENVKWSFSNLCTDYHRIQWFHRLLTSRQASVRLVTSRFNFFVIGPFSCIFSSGSTLIRGRSQASSLVVPVLQTPDIRQTN